METQHVYAIYGVILSFSPQVLLRQVLTGGESRPTKEVAFRIRFSPFFPKQYLPSPLKNVGVSF